jgi:hypothetical protein
MTTFWYNMLDADNAPINARAIDLDADDLGQAMGMIAAGLPTNCFSVHVWMGLTQTPRIEAASDK